MRIFFLAHRVPFPPNKGDKIRAFHELRGLAERGHEVHLFTLADDPRDLAHADALRRWCASVTIQPLSTRVAALRGALALATTGSLSVAYFHDRRLASAVRAACVARLPEAFVAYCSAMAQYVPASYRSQTVADLVDVDSEKWLQYASTSSFPLSWLYRREFRRLRTIERTIAATCHATVLTTPREVALLDADGAHGVVSLVNGVDLEYFAPHVSDAPPRTGEGPWVVFSGAMDYRANVDAVGWFAAEIWPAIRRSHPTARFVIVGRNPRPEVSALHATNGIVVTGEVEDVRPFLHGAAVCVAPLRIARGIQNKVLEAMACGRPVVVTGEVAQCLSVAPSAGAYLATDTAEGIAAAVSSLLDRPGVAQALGASGRQYVEQHHDWGRMLDAFERLVSAAGRRAAA